MIKHIYRCFHLKFIFLLLVSFCASAQLRAQQAQVSGIVSSNGQPLSYVEVAVSGLTDKTVTDLEGKFSIKASKGTVLVFTHEDYKQLEYRVNDTEKIIFLEMESLGKEQKFQVGYSERTKTQLTAAISTVGGETILKSPVSTLNDAIQGNLTGLTVERTSGNEPGFSLSNYYIRGIGTFGGGRTPLFIVDDVERDITQVDPSEVESITVLKDAAATANYGMRGANGVFVVKTKRGHQGKAVVTFNANYGLQTPAQLPEYLGSQEYVKFRNIALKNDGLPIPNDSRYNPEMYNGTQSPYTYANTDWYDEFVRKTSPQQIYRVGIDGGNETVKYYLALGITNQAGIYNYTNENESFDSNPDYKRYNIKANTDINLSKYLTVSLDLGGRLETKRIPKASASTIFTALSTLPPTLPIKNENGSIAGSTVHTNNPYGYLAKNGYSDQNFRYLQGNVSAVQKLDFWVKGLSANMMYAFDSYKFYGRGKSQNFAVYQENQDGSYSKIGEDSDLTLKYESWDMGYALQGTFTAGLAYETLYKNVHSIAADVKYMQSNFEQAGNYPTQRVQNLFGRVTYAYDQRYVAEFGYSYSGSENFRKGKRYGFFPVVSGAWVVSNENFLKNNDQISFLKLRASYGTVGNSNIGLDRFAYMGQFYLGNGYVFGKTYAGSDGSYEGRLSNADLTYEKSKNANIGLDVEFFKNKLALNIDFFRNDRSNIITTRENIVSGVVGQNLPYENIGSVLNKGFEVALKYQDKINDFGYLAQANVSFARNKITYMAETAGLESWTYKTGRQIDVVRGFEALGFFNTQSEVDSWAKSTYGSPQIGDIKYKDQNGDNIIDDNDLVPLGYSNVPEWNFGLTLGATYKNFDLNMLFTAIANRTLVVTNNVFVGMQGNTKVTNTAYDTWQEGVNEATAKYPRLTTEVVSHNKQNSTIWTHKGDYVRLQNIEIGYNLPKNLLSKIKISDARIYVNGYNLFSIDDLGKFNISADYPNAGITAYPEMRVYNIGVNLKF